MNGGITSGTSTNIYYNTTGHFDWDSKKLELFPDDIYEENIELPTIEDFRRMGYNERLLKMMEDLEKGARKKEELNIYKRKIIVRKIHADKRM